VHFLERALALVMNSIERAVFLQTTPLFHRAATATLNALGALAREQWLEAGETVFRQNEPADCFYVVVEGSVRYECDGRQVGQRGPRAVLGLWSAFDGELRRYTACTQTAGRLLRVDYADFQDLVLDNQDLGAGVPAELTREIVAALTAVAGIAGERG